MFPLVRRHQSLSDILRIDPVILRVRADEPDIDHTVGIVDPYDDPIFVACNVEHRAAVLQNDHTTPQIISFFRPMRIGWSSAG
jgi:hypothetical protein